MKYLQNKEEYEKALDDLETKKFEIKELKKVIRKFENENLVPEFDNLDDLRQFLSEEPEDGKFFKYNGDKYTVSV